MKNLLTYVSICIILLISACVGSDDLDQPIVDSGPPEMILEGPFAGLQVANDFSYETTNDITVNLEVPNFLKGAVFTLYGLREGLDSVAVGKATFNADGSFQKRLPLDVRIDSLQIISNYLGLASDIRIPVEGGTASFDYNQVYDRSTPLPNKGDVPSKSNKSSVTNKVDTYTYTDTYNFWGVPDNLAFPDVIEQNLLDDINASLPENVPGGIPATHPEYLSGVETQIVLTKEADVWVTFVSEGAGFRNTLGYYTYPLGQEPTSVDDITSHNIIFPNVSMRFSGGGLIPGDRVYLGRFPANTVVSWFLSANGWNWGNVNDGNGVYYSDPSFNPESNVDLKTHMVLLHDDARDLTLLAFEDLRRDQSSDDDFNDAVFYAKSNPVDAIQIGNLANIDVANDEDGDGINDELDDFPFDPNQAFNNFAPAINSSGKLAYEDLWPNLGDYDFNDLVLDYTYNLIANGDNLITKIEASYTISNIGGHLENGFGITLPIAPSNITSIDRQILNASFLDLASNGTENNTLQNETVIFAFGNSLPLNGQTIDITISLANPISPELLGDVPFNPFIVANGERAKEIHLPDLPPTSKGGFLGEADDFSNASNNRYYKSETNLPWALNIYEGFVPPPENIPISLQYPRFIFWANSGGTQDLDWYIE